VTRVTAQTPVPSYLQTLDFLERRHRRSEKRGRPFTQTAAPKATGGVNAGGRITKKASSRCFCDKIAAVPSFDHAATIDDAAAGDLLIQKARLQRRECLDTSGQ
jgi:hypothetical protein